MPQIFQVLKCYKCLIFQVHFTKKSNKWECKMCGEKQSIKRHYGIGTAQECREHVQKLNEMQGNKTEYSIKTDVDSDDNTLQLCEETPPQAYASKKFKRQSKWAKFIDEKEDISNADDEVECCQETEELEVPKKRKSYMRPKGISDNEYSNTKFLKKKIYDQKHDQLNQCGTENISKWSAYINENKNYVSESSDITLNGNNKRTQTCNKLKDFNQLTTKAAIKKIEYNQEENSKDIERNIFRNTAETSLENKTDQPLEINTKWNPFLESEDSKTETILESKTRTLFSLCDDNDLDFILDC